MNPIITGRVAPGQQLGRKLGFPTANLPLDPASEQLADGVYAARVTVEGTTYGALGYVGGKPTVGGSAQRVLEVHLLDFSGDLYGREITVELLRFMRPEQKFDSTEALRRRIEQDKQEIIHILSCT